MQAGTSQSSDEAISRARALLQDGKLDACMAELKKYWLSNPNSVDAAGLCAELMDQANRAEAAQAMTRLKEALTGEGDAQDLAEHPTATFEAGYHMIDHREYELAIMLLSACLAKEPLDSTLNYELGFAYMAVSNFDEAIQHFQIARKSQNDFDTNLNLSVCYALSRRLKDAKESVALLRKQATTEEEKHELRHREVVIKRLEKLQRKKQLTERDWLYALYGTVELEPSDANATNAGSSANTAGSAMNANGSTSASGSTSNANGSATASEPQKESYRSIAKTLVILKGVLEGLHLIPEAVEFYNPNSRPLAAVLARLFDVQLDSYKGPDRPDHALLVMGWASDIIGPHEAFVGNTTNRSMFAFGLSKQEALPVIPDIVARFTNQLVLPWHERDDLPPDVTPEDAIPEILERAWNLESDPEVLRIVHDSVEYYNEKRELLVMGNCAQFPQRPEYSAEVPNSRQV